MPCAARYWPFVLAGQARVVRPLGAGERAHLPVGGHGSAGLWGLEAEEAAVGVADGHDLGAPVRGRPVEDDLDGAGRALLPSVASR